MQAWSGTRKRAWVIATVVGVGGVAELIADFGAIPALGAELSPAQIVALLTSAKDESEPLQARMAALRRELDVADRRARPLEPPPAPVQLALVI